MKPFVQSAERWISLLNNSDCKVIFALHIFDVNDRRGKMDKSGQIQKRKSDELMHELSRKITPFSTNKN